MTSQVAGTYNLIGFGPGKEPIQERRASGVHVVPLSGALRRLFETYGGLRIPRI